MKTLILRHDSKLSYQYAEIAARSCSDLGIEWEYHEGYSSISPDAAWKDIDILPVEIKQKWNNSHKQRAGLCTASHVNIWKRIAESGEDTVVLEHDALMLHRLDIELPPMRFVALGYKTDKPGKYNHTKAGKTRKIVDIPKFHGTHAYALKHETARYLIEEIKRNGKGLGCVDSMYFKSKKTRVKMAIADPVSAVGFIRESTIWNRSSATNTQYIKSYQENLQ